MIDRTSIVLPTISVLILVGLIGCKDYLEARKLYFVVEMSSSVTGITQVFFDTGNGFNEENSSTSQVRPRVMHRYYLPLPQSGAIRSIRFDPINVTSVLSIKAAAIENAQGDTLKQFPVRSFKAAHHIGLIKVIDDVLVIHTTVDANDPIIVIENSSFDINSNWMKYFVERAWIYAGYVLLGLIFWGFAKYLADKNSKIFAVLSIYMAQYPKTCIVLIGLGAAILSCYPIVFFGMSFAHPAGTGALYSGAPWFPGLPIDATYENFRGSDLGPTPWSNVPNTVVQFDSMFSHFEFPFWNRFVGGGIPLFAQGQSLIGDILHWIPLSMDGSSIGWDIKVVISKAVFAAGMGLLVYRLTGGLLSGVLIAISSCFLGFFAYRFNHPALFVLTYAPLVVLQWDRLGRVLGLPNPPLRACVSQGLFLAVFAWLQFNAGTPKEGVITAVFVHTLGALLFLVNIIPRWGLSRSIGLTSGMGFALFLITAPYWLLFLDALGKSYTQYDVPGVSTFPTWAFVGFFDNLFFERLFGSLSGASTNLFVLFSMSSAMLGLRTPQSSIVYAIWGLFTFAFFIAYGLIPHSILIVIPFINKIQHVGTTFSVPMMILSLVIAGYGIQNYLAASEKRKRDILFFALAVFFSLWIVSLWQSPVSDPISIIVEERYILGFSILFLVVLSLSVNIRSVLRKANYGLVIFSVCFVALHIRHGLHLFTGVNAVDRFVTNPTQRPDFSIKSSAIEYLKKEISNSEEPTRVIGEGGVLFPGSNVRYGLEGLVPVEALRSQNYEKLLKLFDIPEHWGWLRVLKSDEFPKHASALDLLGIGYVMADVGVEMPQNMKLVHSSDLAVWRRDSVWPRAFFVNNVVEVHSPSGILDALADKSHTPFAAVESQSIPQGIQENHSPYKVVSARHYSLTNNSTHFSVEATGPGMIVLGETYYPGDFVAILNDKKVDYIRVNEASKGIWVDKAGKYSVSYTYRPERLNQAILICLFGIVLLFLLLLGLSVGNSGRSKKDSITFPDEKLKTAQ